MRLRELIEELQKIERTLGDQDNPEVRLATQPHHPLEFTIKDVAMVDFQDGMVQDDPDDEPFMDDEHVGRVVYIGEGKYYSYLPGQAADKFWEADSW